MIGLSTSVFGDTRPGTRQWELAASHGFTDIELVAGSGRIDPADRTALKTIRDEATSAGVRIAAVSVPLIEAERALAIAPDLDARLLIARAGPCRLYGGDPRGPSPDGHALRRMLEPLAAGTSARGLALAVEFPAPWPAAEIVRLLESIEAPLAGVCLDLGHAHLHEGAAEAIEQLAGYVLTMHVHDNLGRMDDHRLPFAGAIEWPAVLMELEKTGYAGPLVLELAGEPDAATAISRAVGARTRLQAILDDLAQPMVFPE
jgi:sugar phosphate isomerase/epimerase